MIRTGRESFVVGAGVVAALAAGASVARGQQFDVTADWSNTANPNGVWSYRAGDDPLPSVDNWQPAGFSPAQAGWATGEVSGEAFLPFWFRGAGSELFTHDWLTGDVVVHSTDPGNGGANGPATLVWTSPVRGVVTVGGAVWMGRDIGRGNAWAVAYNRDSLTDGLLSSGDQYSRANPFRFEDGSGGPLALADLTVVRGDTLALVLVRTTASGDFVGVRMTVNVCVGFAVEPSGSRNLCLNDKVEILVEAVGLGELAYRWRRDGEEIPLKGPGSNPTAANRVLVFGAAAGEGGVYDCVVTSECSSLVSTPVTIRICAADFTCDGLTNSTDVGEFINQWFTDQVEGTLVTDVDGNGIVNSTDVGEFINRWFEDIASGCG